MYGQNRGHRHPARDKRYVGSPRPAAPIASQAMPPDLRRIARREPPRIGRSHLPLRPFQMRILLSSLLVIATVGGPGKPGHQVGRQQYDIVIANGRIVDGSGNPWFYGDVAISGDRIARVTPPGMLRDA